MSAIIKFKRNDLVNSLPGHIVQEMAEVVFLDQLSDSGIASKFQMSKPTFYKLKLTNRFQRAHAFGLLKATAPPQASMK